MVMRFLSILVVAAVAGAGLTGCTAGYKKAVHSIGLASGPLPTPQSFVTDSRAAQADTYLPVGVTPPARPDRVLSVSERKDLETGLLATPGRQPSPAELKAKAASATKPVPKKPVPPKKPPDSTTSPSQ